MVKHYLNNIFNISFLFHEFLKERSQFSVLQFTEIPTSTIFFYISVTSRFDALSSLYKGG